MNTTHDTIAWEHLALAERRLDDADAYAEGRPQSRALPIRDADDLRATLANARQDLDRAKWYIDLGGCAPERTRVEARLRTNLVVHEVWA